MAVTNKQNFLSAYFLPFGLRQACDILLIIASIVLIIGLVIPQSIISVIGFAIFAVASALSAFRLIKILHGGISSKSPEHRNALINLVIMLIVLGLSVYGLVFMVLFGL